VLFDGRLNLTLTAWRYEWANRPFPINLVVTRDAQDPADRDGIPLDFPNNFTQNSMGSHDLKGVEFESSFSFMQNWTVQLNASWSENKFTEFSDLFF
jgi:outer membrane receptor protein involved in Fe transport